MGWQARIGAAVLRPVRIDGWKQAWIIPAGTFAEVHLTYLPDATYRLALFAGFAAMGVLFLLALIPLALRLLAPGLHTPGLPAVRTRGQRTGGQRTGGQRTGGQRARGLTPPGQACPQPLRLLPALARAVNHRTAPVLRLLWILPFSTATGVWVAGYPGAVIVPLVTMCFLVVIARGPRSRLARQMSGCWLVCTLMVTASACAAVGAHLRTAEYQGPAVNLLWDVIPQVLCAVIVARLLADLAWGDRPRDRALGTLGTEGRQKYRRGYGVARDPGGPPGEPSARGERGTSGARSTGPANGDRPSS